MGWLDEPLHTSLTGVPSTRRISDDLWEQWPGSHRAPAARAPLIAPDF